jgi:hypothetical protein
MLVEGAVEIGEADAIVGFEDEVEAGCSGQFRQGV